jgi:hypothetical protein
MTTGSDPRQIAGSPVYLPQLASEDGQSEGHVQAYTRTHAREASPAPEQPATGHTPSPSAGRFAAVLAWLDELFKVGQLWHAQPPSLADEWHRQAEPARIWRGPVMTAADPGRDLLSPYFQGLQDPQDPPAPARYAEGPVMPWIRRARWCWAPVPIVVGTLALLWAACYSLPRALAPPPSGSNSDG